jgi:SAM-dependent methyltransferase
MGGHPQLGWDLTCLADNAIIRGRRFGIPAEAKAARYPVRLLRYWFGYQLLLREATRCEGGIHVAEVGVHTGQMYEFYRAMGAPAPARWTAFDAVVLPGKLRKAGYTEVIEANVEDPAFSLGAAYDAALLLHILEHLHAPEAALARVAADIRPGGAIIGGFPVLPHWIAGHREHRIRRTAAPMGHVSAFSPKRVRAMAAQCGLTAEFIAGAYFLRSKGSPLENSRAWLRFNLLWGALLPWWPGEIYWLLRKPARTV